MKFLKENRQPTIEELVKEIRGILNSGDTSPESATNRLLLIDGTIKNIERNLPSAKRERSAVKVADLQKMVNNYIVPKGGFKSIDELMKLPYIGYNCAYCNKPVIYKNVSAFIRKCREEAEMTDEEILKEFNTYFRYWLCPKCGRE